MLILCIALQERYINTRLVTLVGTLKVWVQHQKFFVQIPSRCTTSKVLIYLQNV